LQTGADQSASERTDELEKYDGTTVASEKRRKQFSYFTIKEFKTNAHWT